MPAAEELPAYLVREVPGFAESPELEAVADRTAPGAVTGALGRYLLRLQAKAVRLEADAAETAALARAYAVMEEMAGSEDDGVRRALQLEILERLHANDVVVAAVETRLGPRSLALYRRWAV
jgi:thioredoxin-like negative regulator of GroEL